MKIVTGLVRLVRRPRPAALRRRRWGKDRLVISTVVMLTVLAVLTVFADAIAITVARTMPDGVVQAFRIVTVLGKGEWVLWSLGVVLALTYGCALLASHNLGLVLSSVALRIAFVCTAVALPSCTTDLLKHVVGRARPFVGGSANPYLFHPFDGQSAYESFPSGHATTAVSLAVAMSALWPQARWVAWLYAAVILLSRVVITAHHPSDVIAGALVGGIGALLVRDYFANRSLGFAIGVDGRVHALPVPSWARISRWRGRP